MTTCSSRLAFSFVMTMAVLTAAQASASIIGVNGGTAAPSATLGPYTMTPFPTDIRPNAITVATAPSPLGGDVGFSPNLLKATIGSGWGTWSNGYTGDAYITTLTSSVVTMPANTLAFYFYIEPYHFASYNMTAIADDGTTLNQVVNGNAGANYFGFYATPGSNLLSVSITSADTGGFAIGEFGIAQTPEPASLSILLLGAASLLKRKPTRQNSNA